MAIDIHYSSFVSVLNGAELAAWAQARDFDVLDDTHVQRYENDGELHVYVVRENGTIAMVPMVSGVGECEGNTY